MDAAVPNITAQEAAVAAETTRTEAETCTETRALAQAHFQAKADARVESQTVITIAKWRREVTALENINQRVDTNVDTIKILMENYQHVVTVSTDVNVKVKTLLEDMTKRKAGMRQSEAKLEKVERRIENNTGSLVQLKNFAKQVET